MPLPDYKWTIVTHESTFPRQIWERMRRERDSLCKAVEGDLVETWAPLRNGGGAPFKFVERFDADAFKARLQAVQRHARYEVVPYSPTRR